jgi:hypothetical protein
MTDWRYAAALSRIETLKSELAEAQEHIHDLQADILSITSPEEDAYREVGLSSDCSPVVLKAARKSLLAYFHPDRFPSAQKPYAAERFKAVQATFDRIERHRR